MGRLHRINDMSLIIFILVTLVLYKSKTTTSQTPNDDPISAKLKKDTVSIAAASSDFGHTVVNPPEAVFFPATQNDIQTLIRLANDNKTGRIAARGQGHSVNGQSTARNGIVVNMSSLSSETQGGVGIRVVTSSSDLGPYVDVGAERTWMDVLTETVKMGWSPVTWTDYIHLSVGGTLSNAGISGQTFKFGPQINNVHQLDVITGKGDFVTCSRNNEPELFYSVLGGLGQFGVITRARIAIAPAPTRIKWVRLFYTDFATFSRDEERLISIKGRTEKRGVDYLEGFLIMTQAPLDLSFYPIADQLRVTNLVTKSGIVYAIELAKYYDDASKDTMVKELQSLLNRLNFIRGFSFEKDVSYIEFLDRVGSEEQKLRKLGLWEIAHPWLNLFLPKSQISNFDSAIFKGILLRYKVPTSIVIVYPMNRSKWDDKMSVVIPNEEVFYTVAILHSVGFADWEAFDKINSKILQTCHDSGLMVKQYLPHYKTQQDWIKHFGPKWDNFQKMKIQFDPKNILSPGQQIFTY